MSFLDQLKQQAAQVKAKETAKGRNEEQLKQKFEETVLPTMNKLHLYMHEMTQQLNYIKPDTQVSYDIKGYGTYANLVQNEYILGSYDKEKNSFFVRIFCHAPRKVRFELTEQDAVEPQKDYFWRNNIPFKWGNVIDKRQRFLKAVFELQGQVIIELTFSADYERSAIKLNARNFAEIGVKDYILPPQEITTAFLDKLAMYITRMSDDDAVLKPHEVGSIWGRISDDPKEKLRLQILEEMKAKRVEELKAKQAEAEKAAATKKAAATQTKTKEKKGGLLGGLFGKK